MKQQLVGKLLEKAIPGEVSRLILDSIRNNQHIDSSILDSYKIGSKEIDELYALYRSKLSNVEQANYPRQYVFYLILKEKYPAIDWDIKSTSPSTIVNFRLPLINNLQPSLLTLLLNRVKVSFKSDFEIRSLKQDLLSDESRCCFNDFLTLTNALNLTDEGIRRLSGWLYSTLEKHGTIFILICPDYSVEASGDPATPYKHNFESVGDGIGQIAARIIDILPNLKDLLHYLKLDKKVNVVCAIADYEGFSDQIAKRLKLSKDEFMNRINSSRRAFIQAAQEVMPSINCINFTELSGGEAGWNSKLSEVRTLLKLQDFGLSEATKADITKVAIQRKCLYSRWYEKIEDSIDRYEEIALNQIAEYAVIGYYLSKKYENILVLGGDSELFEPFYRMYIKDLPAIYFKRKYC